MFVCDFENIEEPSFLIWRVAIQSLPKEKNLTPFEVLSVTERSAVLTVSDENKNKTVLKVVSPKSQSIENEITALCENNHKNIVSFLDSFSIRDVLFLQYEHISGVSLIQYIIKRGPLPECEVKPIVRQSCTALRYLHSHGWVHRDIKPDNIVYYPDTGLCKLIDFEFSCRYISNEYLTDCVGTLSYSSPELRKKRYIGPEVDVWSLGVSIFVMVTASFPFKNQDLVEGREIFNPPRNVSISCAHLIQRMLTPDSSKRVTLNQIFKHQWLHVPLFEKLIKKIPRVVSPINFF